MLHALMLLRWEGGICAACLPCSYGGREEYVLHVPITQERGRCLCCMSLITTMGEREVSVLHVPHPKGEERYLWADSYSR